jgi:hypothetical protein
LVLKLLGEVAELRRTVAAQRDEIARLKGGPGRPHIKPSGMEEASDLKPPDSLPKRPRGSTRSKLSIDEEGEAIDLPAFQGYVTLDQTAATWQPAASRARALRNTRFHHVMENLT